MQLETAHFKRDTGTQNLEKICLIHILSLSLDRLLLEEILSIIQTN